MHSDESLYVRAREGNHEAFSALYERYERTLYGFIYKRLGNRQDTDEVFQEAMLAILTGPAAQMFRPGAFAAWLYKVAMNMALNRQRSTTRERSAKRAWEGMLEVAKVEPAQAGELPPPSLEILGEQLSPPQKEVLLMRQAGLSYEQMAAKLRIPVGTVKSRIHTMIKALRKEMAKWHAK